MMTRSNILKCILLSLLSLWVQQASSQAQALDASPCEGTMIIKLKSGNEFVGTINEWKRGEYIEFKTSWSDHFIIPDGDIKKMKPITRNYVERPYSFKEVGRYVSVRAQLIVGNQGARAQNVAGLGGSVSAGYRWSRWHSLGVGVGYDRFVWGSGENIIPIFVEYTSFLSEKNASPFVTVQAGYGMAFRSDDLLLLEAKGGFMVYPAVGLRMGSQETKVTLDLGYKFQQAEFTYGRAWSTDTSEQRLTFKRLSLRLGLMI